MASSSRNGSPLFDAEFRFALSGSPALRHRERCEHALAALPEDVSYERLVLTANLVASLIEADPEEALKQVAEVRTLSDALSTAAAEAYALAVHGLTDHSPDSVGVRVSEARRILAIAHRGETPELAAVGHFLLLTSLLEQGELRTLDLELSPYGESMARFPQLEHSRHTAWFRCLRAILDGRADEAERLADELLADSDEENLTASRSVWAAQIGTIRWMQGRIFEMEPAFLAARHEHPRQQLWEISLAWLWQLQGRDDAAQALFDRFSDLESIPRDRNFLVTVTILAELAAKIGTVEQAELLRDALLPYATQSVPVGFGLAFWGTVARTLGMLALRLGRNDEARSLFRTAIDVCARNGAQAWLAESQLELAELERATGGDLIDARSLAAQAEATAEALGFPALLRRARRALEKLPDAPLREPAADAYRLPALGTARPEIRILGVFDVIAQGGERARWTSRKARELLKMLVARRGTPVNRETLMHMLWPDIHPDALANRFSVALSTVRRALDRTRTHPIQHFIVTDGASLHLDPTALRIDVEDFLDAARRDDLDGQRLAVRLYTGDAFAEEPYAEWAEPLRHEAQTAFCAAAHRVARHELVTGGALAASELYRRILGIEPFDDAAHDGLIRSLTALGAAGQAGSVRLRRELLDREIAG